MRVTSLLLSPHQDDAVLFAAYTVLRVKPLVVTVFGDARAQEAHGITSAERNAEDKQALWWLGDPERIQWPLRDDAPDYDQLASLIRGLLVDRCPTMIFAPLVEMEGHVQHSMVTETLWSELKEPDVAVVEYATYRRGSGRTTTENEVPPSKDWPARKFRAMACYASQINLRNTRPWWSDWDREWYGD